MPGLRLISWGHRRATDPLLAAKETFRAKRPDIDIAVEVRPLSDFEHQGMAGVARSYDLVIFDHPFCGDIAEGGLFLPLDEHLPALLGPNADPLYVGPSLDTYRLHGHVWGAPIDAATPHALVRRDLLQPLGEEVPRSWDEALALGERLAPRGLKLGIGIETPHALAVIASLMANAGRPWHTDVAAPFHIDRNAFLTAYGRLRALLAFCPPETLGWNSIDVHEAMVARDDVAYCPIVYGYATYGEADQRRRLGFAPFAGASAPFEAGSMIGGTAMGISSFSREKEAGLAFVAHMLEADTQDRLIPNHHGQPAFLSAWQRADNDARFNGFYSAALSSMETAWVRPRRPGYPEFQRDAGRIVAEALRAGADGTAAADAVIALAAKL
ncbi:ABC transporter substrate-binding protein [Labrys monachus]|uniref:Multiple sugar transport system substrate-binding protein n=1 Tax=Labrys monachus TaxID=217067 RepID=A0ABU0FJH3_9HYPH|nr:extracellular solute-binding protein [Labrys monachus]MDQ0394763.1 multiple sugar transport system substrate-binding protein [Labrys monachus]